MTEEIIKEHDSKKWREEHEAKRSAEYKVKVTKEAKEQIERWSRTGMLKGIEDDYAKGQMAILLENQRLINEVSTDSGDMAQFKRISIPLVRRVFDPKNCLAWDLVSLQVMIGPTAFVFFNRPDGETAEEIPAKTKRIKSLWTFPIHEDIRQHHNLDEEAAKTAVMSAEICDEFNQEVIEDLRNNVGLLQDVEWSTPEALWVAISNLFDTFDKGHEFKGFGRRPNWIVTGAELAKELKKVAEFEPRSDEQLWLKNKRTGTLNKEITLVECEHLLPNDILVGWKEGPYGSGYVLAPYVPFTRTPVILDPESFNPRAGILTRYGKRLTIKGSSFYARLHVKGHHITVEAEKEEVPLGPLDVGENVEEA